MRKALDKIKSNWKVLLVTIVVVVAICSFIDWIWDKYGQDYALMWVSLFIAVIVAIVALLSLEATRRSLKVTQDSLELTRATTRPFLSITSVVYQPPKTVEIIFCNTGALPTNSYTSQAIFSQTNDFSKLNDLNKLSVPVTHEAPPIFPNEKQQWDLYLAQDRADYINSGNEVYLKIDIKYIYNGKEEGATSRVSYLPKSDKGRVRLPFSILSEGSSWK